MLYIKVYTKSQLVLLRSLIPIIKKKYRLPKEVLDQMYRVLKDRKLGKRGFIAVLLKPLKDDMEGMKDVLNMYPHKLKTKGDIEDIKIEKQESWLTKGKEWYMDTLEIKGESSYIYIIYSMTVKRLYGLDVK